MGQESKGPFPGIKVAATKAALTSSTYAPHDIVFCEENRSIYKADKTGGILVQFGASSDDVNQVQTYLGNAINSEIAARTGAVNDAYTYFGNALNSEINARIAADENEANIRYNNDLLLQYQINDFKDSGWMAAVHEISKASTLPAGKPIAYRIAWHNAGVPTISISLGDSWQHVVLREANVFRNMAETGYPMYVVVGTYFVKQ